MRCKMAILLGAALTLGACVPGNDFVEMKHSWVRLGASADQPAAAYFTLVGGPKDDTLFAVHADNAVSAQMHQTVTTGGMKDMPGMKGMSEMKPVDKLVVPAGQTVTLAPGGTHVMLMGLDGSAKPGGTTHLSLTFTSGLQLEDNAVVVAAGAPEPKF